MDSARALYYTEEDYYRLPEGARAELIEGAFYNMAAPGRIHQAISGELYMTIRQYIKSKEGDCLVYAAPFAVKLFADEKTVVEPDLSVICDRKKLTDRGCSGAPDWIIEIVSPGNPEHDYGLKLSLYKDAGVREYWIVDPQRERIVVYYLEQSSFEINTFKDKVRAHIFEDLQIDFHSMDLT